jgi:hypothetical protein
MNDFLALNKLISLPQFALKNYDAIMLCGTEMVEHFESKLSGSSTASANSGNSTAYKNSNAADIDRENVAPAKALNRPPPPATSHKSVYGDILLPPTKSKSSKSSSSGGSGSGDGGGGGTVIEKNNERMVMNLSTEEMIPLLSALRAPLPPEMEVIFCKLLKILLRSQDNRNKLGKYGILTIICVLKRQKEQKGLACGEICSTILNTCYEPTNIKMFVDEGGLVPILQLLHSIRDVSIMVKILGSLQSICHVPAGRQKMLAEVDSIRRVIFLMRSDDPGIRARASGVIHNISIDIHSIHVIRELDGIPMLIELLKDFSVEVCQAVAGTIQNISRETFSRSLILEKQEVVIQNLFDLVVSNDVNCQVASMGALLNLLTPSLDEAGKSKLREILSDGIVLGSVKSAIFD